jgi:hypothetical protein
MRRVLLLPAILFLSLPVRGADPKGEEFFEKKVRPVLVEHCYQCHSIQAQQNRKLRGGLLLDSRDGLRKGGDSGPAIVPGKPRDGTLLSSLRYTGDTRMPPKGKLPDSAIADFEVWITMGAPDPRAAVIARAKGLSIEEGKRFWAYRQPVRIQPPVVRGDWAESAIDRFVLTKLDASRLQPVADADRATLIRRVYFDLIGLPPTPEEIDTFLADTAPDAYPRLVDRLLASPHFGERWGRHWLDVTRFAESLTLRGFVMKEAWRYRDHVIDTFNRDAPFDHFIREQIAGDLLPADSLEQRRRQLTAVTFLSLGNTNLEEQDKKQLVMDAVDEQLDTLGKTFLAQTIGCARCHDHKFDPIPTKDYYALAGVLRNTRTLEHANVSKWLEMPLPAPPEQEAAYRRYEQSMAVLESRLKSARLTAPGGKIMAVKDLPGVVVDDTQAKKVGAWTASKAIASYVGDGYIHDGDAGKGEKTLTFIPELPHAGKYEVRLAYSPGTNRAPAVPVTVFSADGEKTLYVNQKESPPIDGLFVSLGQYQFEKNGAGYVLIANEGTKGHVIADAVVFIPVEKLDASKPRAADTETIRKLEEELKRLRASAPPRDMVMTVQEEKSIEDARVHIRGSVHNQGELAPRGFLQVAMTGASPKLPAHESGRRQLADWLASPDNPLTARVYANRVWHWLFGIGLVRTTDNFGTTGELPSHPELLDYLAIRFMEGWSVKRLVREVVLSRTYRLSSRASAALTAGDPENRLFGRGNRRRMEAECIRDTILSVSGHLRVDMGGPTFNPTLAADYGYKHTDTRRSVYSPVFRNALPELFEVFDFADPSVTTGRRNVSTVAPQALFLMNHPFVTAQARHAAVRLLAEKNDDVQNRITRAYRLALGRPASEGERRLAEGFFRDRAESPESWALFFQALFGTIDFRYIQ